MTGFTNSDAQRFADMPVAFSLVRYESAGRSGETRAKWFFSVRKNCNGADLIEAEATQAMLLDMQRWIERAMKTVRTDGGRSLAPSAAYVEPNGTAEAET
jgi:hypothetical protein